MMTDEQFDNFVDTCYEELKSKQDIMFSKYKIGLYKEYWFDQVTRKLQFKNNGEVVLEFYIVCIGTWAPKTNTWMWSWGNESLTDSCRKDTEVLKDLKLKTGFDIFEQVGFNCSEEMAYELTSMSVNHLNAIGMYRIPGEKSHLFVALIKETH